MAGCVRRTGQRELTGNAATRRRELFMLCWPASGPVTLPPRSAQAARRERELTANSRRGICLASGPHPAQWPVPNPGPGDPPVAPVPV